MDRRPTMGTHPQFSKLHIFNGLGAKGYLLAPKLAAEMTSYLLDQSPLDPEVSLKRYKFFS
jgi:glycine/D-amino acid oxidase-like deaminating enzyme